MCFRSHVARFNMTTRQPTPAQHTILAYALQHTGGKIAWFPDNLKGGAREKGLDGLAKRRLTCPTTSVLTCRITGNRLPHSHPTQQRGSRPVRCR
ncbi:hypothethical protein (plasmid) [Ralstonia solanacearum CMR15]|nr:hypothethical protein [Ralstonia solanacearum CMR15]